MSTEETLDVWIERGRDSVVNQVEDYFTNMSDGKPANMRLYLRSHNAEDWGQPVLSRTVAKPKNHPRQQAQQLGAEIRQFLVKKFGVQVTTQTRFILYEKGQSSNPLEIYRIVSPGGQEEAGHYGFDPDQIAQTSQIAMIATTNALNTVTAALSELAASNTQMATIRGGASAIADTRGNLLMIGALAVGAAVLPRYLRANPEVSQSIQVFRHTMRQHGFLPEGVDEVLDPILGGGTGRQGIRAPVPPFSHPIPSGGLGNYPQVAPQVADQRPRALPSQVELAELAVSNPDLVLNALVDAAQQHEGWAGILQLLQGPTQEEEEIE